MGDLLRQAHPFPFFFRFRLGVEFFFAGQGGCQFLLADGFAMGLLQAAAEFAGKVRTPEQRGGELRAFFQAGGIGGPLLDLVAGKPFGQLRQHFVGNVRVAGNHRDESLGHFGLRSEVA